MVINHKGPVVVNFDNTAGVPERDCDDLLALEYLRRRGAELPFVLTSFGNHKEAIVYEATKESFKELGYSLPIYRGVELGGLAEENEAAKILVKYSKEILDKNKKFYILSLGSTTNIAHALELGLEVKAVAGVVLMGGITSPLEFANRVMDELNFSCDYKSSNILFSSDLPLIFLTANELKKIPLDKSLTFQIVDSISDGDFAKRLKEWFEYHIEVYGDEIIIWDMITAMVLTFPEAFSLEKGTISSGDQVKKGFLYEGDKEVFYGRIINKDKLIEELKNIFTLEK